MKTHQVQSCKTRCRWVLAVLATGGLVALLGPGLRTSARADDAAIEQANTLSRVCRAAAKKVLPTVVKTRTATLPTKGNVPQEQINPFKGTPFEDFFDDEMPGFRFHGQIPRRGGVGSGVIIDASGIIVTYNHVVEKQSLKEGIMLLVRFGGGNRYVVLKK